VKAKRTVTVDDAEYTISPIPLSYAPYNKRLTKLLSVDNEDVKGAQKELAELVEAILKVTVDKPVLPEHTNLVYTAVADLTADVVKQAELFRGQADNGDKAGS
jgi:hypothetical protein